MKRGKPALRNKTFNWRPNIQWAESKYPQEVRLFLDWRDSFVKKNLREPLPEDLLQMIELSNAPDRKRLATFFLALVKRRSIQKKVKNRKK